MDREYIIKLTNKLYQLTLLFPKKEPLRYKIREVADEVLANSVSNPQPKKEILKELEILDSFFEVVKIQNWVKSEDVLEIQKEYCKMKDGLKGDLGTAEKIIQLPPVKPCSREISLQGKVEAQLTSNNGVISERKQKILEILKEKDRLQVWEVKKVFPEVTKRTLRRDFESLLKQGLIKRIGERNSTHYRLVV